MASVSLSPVLISTAANHFSIEAGLPHRAQLFVPDQRVHHALDGAFLHELFEQGFGFLQRPQVTDGQCHLPDEGWSAPLVQKTEGSLARLFSRRLPIQIATHVYSERRATRAPSRVEPVFHDGSSGDSHE